MVTQLYLLAMGYGRVGRLFGVSGGAGYPYEVKLLGISTEIILFVFFLSRVTWQYVVGG